jgi:ankyrin repeat protein
MLPRRRRDLDEALFIAARKGKDAEILRLINAGACIEAKDALGWTALMEAAGVGHFVTCALLLQKLADVGGDIRSYIEAAGSGGTTALMLAALNGNTDVCRLLLDELVLAGADVKEYLQMREHNKYRRTALMIAKTAHQNATIGFLTLVELVELGSNLFADKSKSDSFYLTFKECVKA